MRVFHLIRIPLDGQFFEPFQPMRPIHHFTKQIHRNQWRGTDHKKNKFIERDTTANQIYWLYWFLMGTKNL